jgi:glycerophosphoryl diester phosphodiesterase
MLRKGTSEKFLTLQGKIVSMYTGNVKDRKEKLKDTMQGRSLIWYNTLWDTMAGGHDDDASLQSFENGYGYLIDVLGARIIQTDRPQFLLDYLRSRNLHD